MDDQNKNLILASVLSFVVIVAWFILFPPPEKAPQAVDEPAVATQENTASTTPVAVEQTPAVVQQEAAAETRRLSIKTDRVNGSISTTGGRIDDLKLVDYHETVDATSPEVTLLRPVGQEGSYYSAFGWAALSGVDNADVPTPETVWNVSGNDTLTTQTPVTLTWSNGKGLDFERTISIDENYMFSVTQTVKNISGAEVSLRPYGLIRRHGIPADVKNFFVLHEGLVRMSDGALAEDKYKAMKDYSVDDREGTNAVRIDVSNDGWVGFTDHFWMTTLIPEAGVGFRSTGKYYPSSDIFQAEAVMAAQVVAQGMQVSTTTKFFAGAKEWETIRNYEKAGIAGFLDSIDWGWFFFITKPMFAVLHWLNSMIGNMGWSIIGLTFFIKALLFPLAYKSSVSMAKMKALQPEMEKLKERVGDDRAKLQQEMMALYKKEKVNPASGCLPILLQIPIFFSLYKVIFVTLELRHAPWVGWIKDLSAPDTSSILNLFGLLPYATPGPDSIFAIVSLGILPILLGISMWLQQKLNPAPTDPTQAMIFAWMPWVFMFMLGSFASGLVIYWITNNTITFTQQYLIMRAQGIKPDVFGNIKSSMKRKKTAK